MSIAARVEHLGVQLQRPVVLYDRAMRLLAYSAHSSEEIDENRRGAILQRRTGPRALELIRASGAHLTHTPVVIASDPGLADRFGIAVRNGGVLLGYIVGTAADEEEALSPQRERLLISAAHDLGVMLSEVEADQRLRGVELNEAIRLSVEGSEDERSAAASLLLAAGLPESTNYVVSVIAPRAVTDAELNPAERSRLQAAMALMLPTFPVGSLSAIVSHGAVVVSASRLDLTRTVPQLRQHLPSDLCLGIGAKRASLTGINDSAGEAFHALNAARRDPIRYRRVALWPDLGPDQLLVQLPLADISLTQLPPAVRILLSAPNGPEFARTVAAYLDHGGDAQATAKALSIHRSTLYYRLDRVTALTGTDPRAGAERFGLQLGLRVATLLGLLPAGPAGSTRQPVPPAQR